MAQVTLTLKPVSMSSSLLLGLRLPLDMTLTPHAGALESTRSAPLKAWGWRVAAHGHRSVMGLGNRLPTPGGVSLPAPSGRRAWLLGGPAYEGSSTSRVLRRRKRRKGKPRSHAGSHE